MAILTSIVHPTSIFSLVSVALKTLEEIVSKTITSVLPVLISHTTTINMPFVPLIPKSAGPILGPWFQDRLLLLFTLHLT